MTQLNTDLNSTEALHQYCREVFQDIAIDERISPMRGNRAFMQQQMEHLDPAAYGATRNYGDGSVTRLSPFIRHGVVTTHALRQLALQKKEAKSCETFIRELAWREFWHHVHHHHPEWLWEDIEPYKTGLEQNDYANELPKDILNANTDSSVINYFIHQLYDLGYVHNHARMYLASYLVHWYRVKWQVGAKWFLSHLLDGDVCSNNFSWQWVASTFSHKPYIFNLENVQKYFRRVDAIDLSPSSNPRLAKSYDDLQCHLFK